MSKKFRVCKNFTYYTIIKEAILAEKDQKATSTQIFTYITTKHPHLFKQSNSMTWKGNIRQLLSKNPEFVKLQKDEVSKLHYWKYVPLDEIVENEREALYRNGIYPNPEYIHYSNLYDQGPYRYTFQQPSNYISNIGYPQLNYYQQSNLYGNVNDDFGQFINYKMNRPMPESQARYDPDQVFEPQVRYEPNKDHSYDNKMNYKKQMYDRQNTNNYDNRQNASNYNSRHNSNNYDTQHNSSNYDTQHNLNYYDTQKNLNNYDSRQNSNNYDNRQNQYPFDTHQNAYGPYARDNQQRLNDLYTYTNHNNSNIRDNQHTQNEHNNNLILNISEPNGVIVSDDVSSLNLKSLDLAVKPKKPTAKKQEKTKKPVNKKKADVKRKFNCSEVFVDIQNNELLSEEQIFKNNEVCYKSSQGNNINTEMESNLLDNLLNSKSTDKSSEIKNIEKSIFNKSSEKSSVNRYKEKSIKNKSSEKSILYKSSEKSIDNYISEKSIDNNISEKSINNNISENSNTEVDFLSSEKLIRPEASKPIVSPKRKLLLKGSYSDIFIEKSNDSEDKKPKLNKNTRSKVSNAKENKSPEEIN